MYLREDPISGTQVENQSELRAPTAHRAAYYLDAAIASRTVPGMFEIINYIFTYMISCTHLHMSCTIIQK